MVMGWVRCRRRVLAAALTAGVVWAGARGWFGGGSAAADRGGAGFSDVPAWHWAAEYVYGLAARGVVAGVRPWTFEPGRGVSRAEFAKMVCAAVGAREGSPGSVEELFSDVRESEWYTPYVVCAAERGLMLGWAGQFRPGEPLTRAEAATVAARVLAGAGVSGTRGAATGRERFADARDIPEWAREGVGMCLQVGIIEGYEDGAFRPLAQVSRAEAAAMVFRCMDLMGTLYDATGTVVAVDATGRRAVVDLGTLGMVSVDVDDVWRDGVKGGDVLELDEVGLIMASGGRVLHAAVVTSAASGVVAWVDAGAGKLAFVSRRDGMVRTVRLAEGAKVFRQGRLDSLSSLREGDTVSVVFERATRRARAVDAKRGNLAGVVAGIEGQTVILQPLDGGQPVKVLVPDGCVVLVDGSRASVGDLKAGDRVLVWEQGGKAEYVEAFRFEAGM
ncbi:MAG: S-layer homology domain-containing protein [Bacillota bacterium]